MGRKSPKKYSKMGYFEKQEFIQKQGDKYGINRDQFENAAHGGGRYEDFDYDGYRKAVTQAMGNDYDTRRSIELAQESGNKKALKLGDGISNMSEAVAAERFMTKTHSNRIGATGKYDGANDEGNVMNYWKDKVMGKRSDGIDRRFEDMQSQFDTQQKQSEASAEPVELSQRAQNAIDSEDFGFTPGSLNYRKPEASSAPAYDPNLGVADAKSGQFMNKYKSDIMKGISKDGTPGRGPGSIHYSY